MAEDACISLNAPAFPLSYTDISGKVSVTITEKDGRVLIPVGERRLLSADTDPETFSAWLEAATL